MLLLSLKHLAVLLLLLVLFTFEKVLGVPLLALLASAYLASQLPSLARIGLVVMVAVVLAGLFGLPVSLVAALVGAAVYGWIGAERFADHSSVARVLLLIALTVIWMVLVRTQISTFQVVYLVVLTIGTWVFLERTQYAI